MMVTFPCLFRVWPELPAHICIYYFKWRGNDQTCSRCGGRRSGAAVQWWDPWVIWQHYEVLGSWEKSAWKWIICVLCVAALRELTFLSSQLLFFLPVNFFISLFRWKSSNLSVVFPHTSTLPGTTYRWKKAFSWSSDSAFTESSFYLQWNCFILFFFLWSPFSFIVLCFLLPLPFEAR